MFNVSENNERTTTGIRTYTTNDPKTTEPLNIVDIGNMVVTGKNNNHDYMVGLSDKKNTPLKSSQALHDYESVEIEIDGVTQYYWSKKGV